MKTNSRILALVLAIAMIFSLSITTFAVPADEIVAPTEEKKANLYIEDTTATKNADGTYSATVKIVAAMKPGAYRQWMNAAFTIGLPNTDWAKAQIINKNNYTPKATSINNNLGNYYKSNGNDTLAATDELAYIRINFVQLEVDVDENGLAYITLDLKNFTRANVGCEDTDTSFDIDIEVDWKGDYTNFGAKYDIQTSFESVTFTDGKVLFPAQNEIQFEDGKGNAIGDPFDVEDGDTIPEDKFTDAEDELPETDPATEIFGWVDKDNPDDGYITPETVIDGPKTLVPVTKTDVTTDPEKGAIGANDFERAVADGTLTTAQALTLAAAAAYDADGNALTPTVVSNGQLQTINTHITKNEPGEYPLTFTASNGLTQEITVTVTTKYTINFTDPDGKPIGDDLEIKNGDTIPEDDFPEDEVTVPEDKELVGWEDQDGNLIDPTTPIDGDKTIKPVIKDNVVDPTDPDSSDDETAGADNITHDVADGPLSVDDIFDKAKPQAWDADGNKIPLDSSCVVDDDGKLDDINDAISKGISENPDTDDGTWPLEIVTPNGTVIKISVDLTAEEITIPDPDDDEDIDGEIIDGIYTIKILRTGDTGETDLTFIASKYIKTLPTFTFGANGTALTAAQINALTVSKVAVYTKNGSTYSFVDSTMADSGLQVTIANGKITVRGSMSVIAKVTISNGSTSVDVVVIIPGDINLDEFLNTNDATLAAEADVGNISLNEYVYQIFMADMNNDTLVSGDVEINTNDATIIAEMDVANITPSN